MHIGAWQEYKLYKILLMRENYKQNGLYQLSTQNNEGRVRRKATSVKFHPSVVSNAEKTTEIDNSLNGSMNSGKTSVVEAKKRTKSLDKKIEVIKTSYKEWMNYEKAKEKAHKAFLDSFKPPLVPIPRVKKLPLIKKATTIHKVRIKKLKAIYKVNEEEKKVNILPPIVPKMQLEEAEDLAEKVKRSVDENEMDELIDWALNLPEDLSSSIRKGV